VGLVQMVAIMVVFVAIGDDALEEHQEHMYRIMVIHHYSSISFALGVCVQFGVLGISMD